MSCKGNGHSNCFNTCHNGECLIVVDALLLVVSMNYQIGHIPGDTALHIHLVPEHPFSVDYGAMFSRGN